MPRTAVPGERAGATESGRAVRAPESKPVDGSSSRGSYPLAWRAPLLMGCVIGALSVIAVMWTFPTVAAAIVPNSVPEVAAQQHATQTHFPDPQVQRPLFARKQNTPTQGTPQPEGDETSFLEIVRAHHAKRANTADVESDEKAELGVDVRIGKSLHHGKKNANGKHASSSPRRAGNHESDSKNSKEIKMFRLPELGGSVTGVWRSGLEQGMRPEVENWPEDGEHQIEYKKQNAHPKPVARLGAEATATLASIGEATGKQVGEALVSDLFDSASNALAMDGESEKQERRDVFSDVLVTQKRAESQSVDPAGDLVKKSREAQRVAREASEMSSILVNDEADPLLESVFSLSSFR